MSLKWNIWLAYINGIELQYMLNIWWIILFEQVIAIWLVGNLTFDVLKKAWTFTLLNPHYTVIMAIAFCQQEESSHLLPASLVYIKSVHKVFIALFVEYPLCFLLCHNLRLHMLKTCGIGKTALSVSCARFKSHICKSRSSLPTLRSRNSCICPCLSRRRRSTQISRLYPFSSRRQAKWTPVQASCLPIFLLLTGIFFWIELNIVKKWGSIYVAKK